jgi:hypothetical protein
MLCGGTVGGRVGGWFVARVIIWRFAMCPADTLTGCAVSIMRRAPGRSAQPIECTMSRRLNDSPTSRQLYRVKRNVNFFTSTVCAIASSKCSVRLFYTITLLDTANNDIEEEIRRNL